MLHSKFFRKKPSFGPEKPAAVNKHGPVPGQEGDTLNPVGIGPVKSPDDLLSGKTPPRFLPGGTLGLHLHGDLGKKARRK